MKARAANAVSSSGGVREERNARMLEQVFAGATAMLLGGVYGWEAEEEDEEEEEEEEEDEDDEDEDEDEEEEEEEEDNKDGEGEPPLSAPINVPS